MYISDNGQYPKYFLCSEPSIATKVQRIIKTCLLTVFLLPYSSIENKWWENRPTHLF